MKKFFHFLTVFTFLTFILSCKKSSSSNPTYYVKFSIEGKNYSISDYTSSSLDRGALLSDGGLHSQGFYHAVFDAITSVPSGIANPTIEIEVRDTTQKIHTGNYDATRANDLYAITGVRISLILAVNDTYVKTKSFTGYKTAHVTITELNNQYTKGTFFGTAIDDSDPTDSVVVTNGEFNLQRTDN